MKRGLVRLYLGLMVGVATSGIHAADANGSKDTPEAHILSKIHLMNGLEMQAGNLAQTYSSNETVKGYGRMLVRDHMRADEKTAAIAKQEGFPLRLPTAQSGAEKAQMNRSKLAVIKLEELKGQDFDLEFGRAMADSHRDAIAELEQASALIPGTATAALIAELLPQLREHERVAENLEPKG